MIMSLKQKKIKFKPMIKLNHNIYVVSNILSQVIFFFWRGGGGSNFNVLLMKLKQKKNKYKSP